MFWPKAKERVIKVSRQARLRKRREAKPKVVLSKDPGRKAGAKVRIKLKT